MKRAKKIVPSILMIMSIFSIILLFCVTVSYASPPETTMVQSLTEYGPLGIAVVALCWFIMFLMKKMDKNSSALGLRMDKINNDHREEREQWRQNTDRRQEKSDDVIDKNTSALVGHTIAMADIKNILQALNKP